MIKNNEKGMTFVELMIIIVMVAILVTIAFTPFLKAYREIKQEASASDVQVQSNAPTNVYLSDSTDPPIYISPSDSLEFGTLAILQPHAYDSYDKNESRLNAGIKKTRLYEIISKDTSYYEEVYQDTTLFGEVSYEKGTTSLYDEDPFYVVKAEPGNYSYFLEVEDRDGNKIQSDPISVSFTGKMKDKDLHAAMMKTDERFSTWKDGYVPTLNLTSYGDWKKAVLYENDKEIVKYKNIFGKKEWSFDLSSDNAEGNYTYVFELEDNNGKKVGTFPLYLTKKVDRSGYLFNEVCKVLALILGSCLILGFFIYLILNIIKDYKDHKKWRKEIAEEESKRKFTEKFHMVPLNLCNFLPDSPFIESSIYSFTKKLENLERNINLDSSFKLSINETKEKIFSLTEGLGKKTKYQKEISNQISAHEAFKEKKNDFLENCRNDVSLDVAPSTVNLAKDFDEQLAKLQKENDELEKQIPKDKEKLKELCNLLEQKVKRAEFLIKEAELGNEYKHLKNNVEKVMKKIQ